MKLRNLLNYLEPGAGGGMIGLGVGTHITHEMKSSLITTIEREFLEEAIKIYEKIGLDPSRFEKTLTPTPYPYATVIGCLITGVILCSDTILRMYRGEGLFESIYFSLKKVPHYIKSKFKMDNFPLRQRTKTGSGI